MNDEEYIWLRDQHPRGLAILAQRAADAELSTEQQEGQDLPPYEEWSLADLKAEAKARGLKQTGNEGDLAERLNKHDAEAQA